MCSQRRYTGQRRVPVELTQRSSFGVDVRQVRASSALLSPLDINDVT